MPQYKFSNPYEWLEWRLEHGDIEDLINRLISKLDFDDIQDLFQEEMDEDGYFEELDGAECQGCGNSFDKSEMHMREDEWYCTDCALKWEDENAPQLDCYYRNEQFCRGELWTCITCGEDYCEQHNHTTALGNNVECVACERERLNAEGNP